MNNRDMKKAISVHTRGLTHSGMMQGYFTFRVSTERFPVSRLPQLPIPFPSPHHGTYAFLLIDDGMTLAEERTTGTKRGFFLRISVLYRLIYPLTGHIPHMSAGGARTVWKQGKPELIEYKLQRPTCDTADHVITIKKQKQVSCTNLCRPILEILIRPYTTI